MRGINSRSGVVRTGSGLNSPSIKICGWMDRYFRRDAHCCAPRSRSWGLGLQLAVGIQCHVNMPRWTRGVKLWVGLAKV
eukprot:1345519-Amorphochlora_amoeboformis.AAC.1